MPCTRELHASQGTESRCRTIRLGLAKAWVENYLGQDGDWNRTGTEDRYASGSETETVELVEFRDAAGFVISNPVRGHL